MSSSAVSFGEGCAVAPSCAESPTESCSEMQQDSCEQKSWPLVLNLEVDQTPDGTAQGFVAIAGPSMQETSGSYFEEEADFLTELLVKQVCKAPAG